MLSKETTGIGNLIHSSLHILNMNTHTETSKLTIDFLKDSIGKEFTYHYYSGKSEVIKMSEFLLQGFIERETLIKNLTPNF